MDPKKVQKLTENIIYQRIKSCPRDLSKITQLNITGRNLVDVSLLRKLTGLEILSLSVNKINTLAYFSNCRKLKALYLRQNKIKDLYEVKYIISLPNLTRFSLLENPCASDPNYRFTVIKNLKNLMELDDVPIVPDEKRKAMKFGKELYEDFEPFFEQTDSDDNDCDSFGGSENVQDGDKYSYSEMSDEAQPKDLSDEVGDGDVENIIENVELKKESNANRKLRTETQSLSPCLKETKVAQCTAGESEPEVPSPQGNKLRAPTSNRYSAILILVKELARPELEALQAEVDALLSPVS